MSLFPSRLRAFVPVLLLALGSIPPALVAQEAAPKEVPNLPYVTGGGERQQLDLYLPATPGGPARPVVLWIHGGAWESGDRHVCPAAFLVGRGYVVASVGYRLSNQAVFPAQIEDCKAAVRWLRAHAADYGIDPKRVGAWGVSAGGHLAAMLGTNGQSKKFDVGENLDQSSAVQCVVDWYGETDLLHYGGPSSPLLSSPDNKLSHLLGGTVDTHRDLAKSASPVDAVSKESAPFLIMHGDKDPNVPLQQSQELDAALRKAGVESTLVVLPGAGHGTPEFGQPSNMRQMVAFLDRHLGAGHPPAQP